jgi:hypothetical protein
VVIPEWVTKIEKQAFEDNKLTRVVIPNSVTSLWNYTFHNNEVTELIIWTWVTAIPQWFLQDNRWLLELTIPDTVVSVGGNAFKNANLTNLKLWTWLQTIWWSAFNGNKLSWELIIPDSVLSIWWSAFELAFDNYATNNSIIIWNWLTNLSTKVIKDNKLQKIVFWNGVETISNRAIWSQWANLKSFLLPNSITAISGTNGSYTWYILKDPSTVTNESSIKLVRLFVYTFVNSWWDVLATWYYQSW